MKRGENIFRGNSTLGTGGEFFKFKPMQPLFFTTQEEFRRWMEANYDKLDEQWVGYFKKHTGKPSMTWDESVDVALCFGWIDGLRKSIDSECYMIRFTPRRPRSIWSAKNIKRVGELKELGLMHEEGLKAFRKKDEKRANSYSFEWDKVELSKEYKEVIKANKKAWEFFKRLPPSVKKPSVWWVMSARQEKTRQRRLNVLIESSEKHERIPLLRYGKK